MKNVYVIGGGFYSAHWTGLNPVSDMKEADLLILTGGEDISPVIYGDPMHVTTCPNPHRDQFELGEIKRGLSLGKCFFGICRGAQMLCAIAGGRLVQDQQNPRSRHAVITRGGKEHMMSSCHHQAQYPWRIKQKWLLLGWTKNLSEYHVDGWNREVVNGVKHGVEVEDAYYPHIKALAVQGHPEWLHEGEDGNTLEHYRTLIDQMLDGKLS